MSVKCRQGQERALRLGLWEELSQAGARARRLPEASEGLLGGANLGFNIRFSIAEMFSSFYTLYVISKYILRIRSNLMCLLLIQIIRETIW